MGMACHIVDLIAPDSIEHSIGAGRIMVNLKRTLTLRKENLCMHHNHQRRALVHVLEIFLEPVNLLLRKVFYIISGLVSIIFSTVNVIKHNVMDLSYIE